MLLLWAAGCAHFIATGLAFQDYFVAVDNFRDSMAFMSLAWAIHHWDFRGVVSAGISRRCWLPWL